MQKKMNLPKNKITSEETKTKSKVSLRSDLSLKYEKSKLSTQNEKIPKKFNKNSKSRANLTLLDEKKNKNKNLQINNNQKALK